MSKSNYHTITITTAAPFRCLECTSSYTIGIYE